MSLTPRNGISVVQIFVFTNVLSVATYLAYRDGFDRSPDWVFLVAFSMLRSEPSLIFENIPLIEDREESPSRDFSYLPKQAVQLLSKDNHLWLSAYSYPKQ